jgi:hypothetical protein
MVVVVASLTSLSTSAQTHLRDVNVGLLFGYFERREVGNIVAMAMIAPPDAGSEACTGQHCGPISSLLQRYSSRSKQAKKAICISWYSVVILRTLLSERRNFWGMWVRGFGVAQQEIWSTVHPAAPVFNSCEAVIASTNHARRLM